MANNPSARKRIRQTAKRTVINKSRVSRIRTFVRKLESALASGNAEAATVAFQAAEPEIRRGVSKGVLHMNTAARKISRLGRRVKALNASKAGAEAAAG
ncbi:30S ribosomal protein S20 [Geminicoccaceae bacterium 1502E]|uniref:Small ribosomal subunit protein bS20 n=1 Tax=Marinimicrococcus flavescens TaxID=3031815 RepID=A0AAP3XPR7_9PROT|nr:30S ribosomal protein S20 [Marinimicrococcus flavescens]MDX6751841.1 30S ribosomal protein S20 [Geminicoccaceae bacterium 1502E]